MKKKLAILFFVMAFVAGSAFAGNIPEFDAVGNDSTNVFNDSIKDCVVANNGINLLSNWFFTVSEIIDPLDPTTLPLGAYGLAQETFYTTAADAAPDPCFDACLVNGYNSHKTAPWLPTFYQWLIVLQMMPETDLDLNIRDCVLKENQTDIWFYAQQTGRYRQSNGKLVFKKLRNPRLTVWAIPGPKASPGFDDPFLMDARKMPNLGAVTLDNRLYTSKALWEEGIVMALPEPLGSNDDGDPQYVLREGDMMFVQVNIPYNNPVDIWYGPDNVVIKYVGIVGMDYTT